jgi:hypothetical protein
MLMMLLCAALQVAQPSPPAASPAPVPVEERADVAPPAPAPDDKKPALADKNDREKNEQSDGDGEEDDDKSVLLGSAIGCAAGGGLPALGTGGGLAIFFGANSLGALGAALLQTFGAVVAVLPLAALGPCGSLGATCGGCVSSLSTDADWGNIFWWSIPGFLTGVLGGVVGVSGLFISTSTSPAWSGNQQLIGTVAIATGTVLSLAAGPITTTLITVTEEKSENNITESDDPLHMLDARAPASRAMRY